LLAARYRVEVRDEKGRLVTALEDDSRSFTMNFIKLLIASHYNQNDVPTFSFYDVDGNLYYTGNVQSSNVVFPWQIFNIGYYNFILLPRSYFGAVPAIWLGTSSCPNPALANGPCGSLVACCISTHYPFSPYNLSPSAPCYGITSCSPSLTEEGWTLTITNQWLNVSQSPVTVASMALVFTVYYLNPASETYAVVPYAAIVDNLPSPVTVWPGYLITVSYTIYFPV
jgi:hypothetical protein